MRQRKSCSLEASKDAILIDLSRRRGLSHEGKCRAGILIETFRGGSDWRLVNGESGFGIAGQRFSAIRFRNSG